MILNSRDQDLFCLLDQVVLDCPNMLYAANVLVEPRVNGHVLGPDCESLGMLVLLLDVEDEGNASWILGHQLFEKTDCQMDTLYHKGLITSIECLNYFA